MQKYLASVRHLFYGEVARDSIQKPLEWPTFRCRSLVTAADWRLPHSFEKFTQNACFTSKTMLAENLTTQPLCSTAFTQYVKGCTTVFEHITRKLTNDWSPQRPTGCWAIMLPNQLSVYSLPCLTAETWLYNILRCHKCTQCHAPWFLSTIRYSTVLFLLCEGCWKVREEHSRA